MLLLLLPAALLGAQEAEFSLSLAGEANYVTLQRGLGAGGAAAVEYRFNSLVAADVRFALSFPVNNNLSFWDTVTLTGDYAAAEGPFVGLEGSMSLRFYFLRFRVIEFFAAAGVGLLATNIGVDNTLSRSSVEVEVRSGFRLLLGNRFYLEPYGRVGYPFLWGAGLGLGLRFPIDPDPVRTRLLAERALTPVLVEEIPPPEVPVVTIVPETPAPPAAEDESAGSVEALGYIFYFPSGSPNFSGIEDTLLENNRYALNSLVTHLAAQPAWRVYLRGDVYPIVDALTGRQVMLDPQSGERVLAVRSLLIQAGIPWNRIVTSYLGPKRPVLPAGTTKYLNYRVECFFIDGADNIALRVLN